MKTLKDYSDLIHAEVQKVNDKDQNWRWSVKSIGKYNARIRWTYLDYLGENENCFMLTLRDKDEDFDDMVLSSRTPHATLIDCHFLTDNDEKMSWQESFENGIKSAIQEIAYHAHSRY